MKDKKEIRRVMLWVVIPYIRQTASPCHPDGVIQRIA